MNKKINRCSSLCSIHITPFLLILALVLSSCNIPFSGEKPPCGKSTLQIGDVVYQIKETKTKSDGSLKTPSNTPDIAYWVNQTETNHVFALSPTSENRALQNANPEQAVVTWANCNSSTYVLSAPQAGVPDMNALLDQSISGITIFVQDSFVMHGEFIGEEIQVFDTPDPSEILAEISLLETTASADKTTISVKVSIANVGQSAITLTPNDVSLLVNNNSSPPTTSNPILPKEIASGATETFSFTFTHPNIPGATLKIFSAEYELEY